jgi:hypothetical protein
VVIGDAVFDFEPELDDLPPEEREAVLAAEAEADLEDDDLSDPMAEPQDRVEEER